MNKPDTTKIGKAAQADARHQRLSAALRENLKRRKEQARGKAAAGEKLAAAGEKLAAGGEELAADDLAARDAGVAEEPDFRRNPGPESGGTGRSGVGRRGS